MMRKIIRKIRHELIKLQHTIILEKDKNYIRSLKNKYKGKRCFIIGNGPSLKVEDLECLKSDITFGTNRIYQIFSKTNWRPSYYLAQDYRLITESKNELDKLEIKNKLIAEPTYEKMCKIKNAKHIKINVEEFYPQMPKFSEDISKCIYEGYTVTYMCLQVAVYMGFKEIYLLGVDHKYSVVKDERGNIIKYSNTKDHFSENDKIANLPQLYKSTLAYEAANNYAKKHNIKIYNATRGGELEVFSRVDFDTLFCL